MKPLLIPCSIALGAVVLLMTMIRGAVYHPVSFGAVMFLVTAFVLYVVKAGRREHD